MNLENRMKMKKKESAETGFELGTSGHQTDALDHSASLEDVQKCEKCHK